jgi:hypothetical protein
MTLNPLENYYLRQRLTFKIGDNGTTGNNVFMPAAGDRLKYSFVLLTSSIHSGQ